MTSPSEQKNQQAAEQTVNTVVEALDASVTNMPEQKKADIASARMTALKVLRQKQAEPQKLSYVEQVTNWITQPFSKVAFPVAAAVLVAVSLNYQTAEPIPQLPLAMMNEEVPTEDLTMLEDLEFVTWLAENPQEALL